MDKSVVEEQNDENDDSLSPDKNKEPDYDAEYYNNIAETPISAFQGFILYLKIPDSPEKMLKRILNKRMQKKVSPIDIRNIQNKIHEYEKNKDGFNDLNDALASVNEVKDLLRAKSSYKIKQKTKPRKVLETSKSQQIIRSRRSTIKNSENQSRISENEEPINEEQVQEGEGQK